MATSGNNFIDSSLPSQGLVGKVALATGGATAIGENFVSLFHKHGAKVCIVDVQDNLGLQVCQSLGDGPNVCFLHCNVTIEEEARSAVDFVVDKFGTLDIMVKNARLSGYRKYDLSDFEKVRDVNVKGVFLGIKLAARIMTPHEKGSIISICSVWGVIGDLGLIQLLVDCISLLYPFYFIGAVG